VIQGQGGLPPLEIAGLLAVTSSLIGLVAVATQKRRWSTPDFAYLSFSALIPFLSYSIYIEA